jgi:hypothetical protein
MARTPDKDYFLKNVPPDGVSIGNKKLKTKLRWETEKYFRIRNALVEEGEILVGRGKGGSIYLSENSGNFEKSKKAGPKQIERTPESSLYEPVCKALKEYWIPELFPKFTDFEIEITANQGSKNTGGVWTRPDLAVFGYGAYRFFPGRTYELISFEVKKADSTDVRTVFEAKGHTRKASRSYVVCVGKLDAEVQQKLREIALDQKVGFILAPDENDFESWEVLVDPIRCEPDPMWIDEFVGQNFSEEQQRRIESWCR